MHSVQTIRPWIQAALASLAWALAGHAASPIVLRDEAWTVKIDPGTLSVQATKQNGRRVTLSRPVMEAGQPVDIRVAATEAQWRLKQVKLDVFASLVSEGFRLTFRNAEPGTVTWPVLGEEPGLEACVLPREEGFYVPYREELWREFLTMQSPLRTMSDLSMPMWGLRYPGLTIAYIMENPFDNELVWERSGGELRMRLTHRFQRNQPGREHRMLVRFGGDSPVEAALLFRQWFSRHYQFVSYRDKIRELPNAEKLLGAAHIYLWANSLFAEEDVTDWPGLVRALVPTTPGTPEQRVFGLLSRETQTKIRQAARNKYVPAWVKRDVLAGLSTILSGRDKALVESAIGRYLAPPETRGSAISPKFMRRLYESGFDRLWLGAPGKEIDLARQSPETVTLARDYGYLFGPYDSYHSIHSPSEKDTWETAQFDQELYDKGGIINGDGTKNLGFLSKGVHLSSIAAKPYVVRRVEGILRDAPFNSWFVDCDATGELFDNYSPQFPQTKEQDMRYRLERMRWLVEQKHMVVGSEGGAWFAAPAIHFAHGMMTPLFGWKDPLLRDPESKYFLGRYAPPEAPAMFFQEVEVPEKYRALYFDPRYRLPLYQTAFHDAVITTNHWSMGTLKFSNVVQTRELLELLYGVPPLYHLNQDGFSSLLPAIKGHYDFFSPLHREIGALPMTSFEWLTPDRLVQRTVFGDQVEVIANFGRQEAIQRHDRIPPRSLVVRRPGANPLTYTPKPVSRSHATR